MPATSVRPFDTSKAIVTRKIVFRKEVRDGKAVYIREPYLLVSYNRQHQGYGPYEKFYYQPTPGTMPIPSGSGSLEIRGNDEQTTSAREESYDEIVVLDAKDPYAPHVGGR